MDKLKRTGPSGIYYNIIELEIFVYTRASRNIPCTARVWYVGGGKYFLKDEATCNPYVAYMNSILVRVQHASVYRDMHNHNT